MKKSRVWQAIVPGTQTKPQDTLRIRKTPWHGVTKQPPAVPLQTPLLNGMKLAGIPLLGHRAPLFQAQKSVHRAPKTLRAGMLAGNSTRHPSNQENTLARRDETAVPLPGPNVTPEPNEKSRVWQAIVPGTQNKPQDTLQIRKTPWHGVTKQPPPAVPLPGPNVTPEPNEKIKGLAGNCSRHKENIVARRDCRPSGRPNVTPEPMKTSRFWQANPLFQAQKASQKTPFESGKHPGTA